MNDKIEKQKMNTLSKQIVEKIQLWLDSPINERDKNEVINLVNKNETKTLKEMFFKDLEFGTGGMRGIMGNGSAQMNLYTISKATKAVAEFFKKEYEKNKKIDISSEGNKKSIIINDSRETELNNVINENKIFKEKNDDILTKSEKFSNELSVVISYDTRHNSEIFSKIASIVFAKYGYTVYRFSKPLPTPVLSFSIPYVKATCGVMITASHNPPEYNGYKVFDFTGCQVIDPKDAKIVEIYKKIKVYENISIEEYEEIKKAGNIIEIYEPILSAYDEIIGSELNARFNLIKKPLKIVYTSLHGTGYETFSYCIKRHTTIEAFYPVSQITPDGSFPTVKSPNPEDKDALIMALDLAKDKNADCVIATDPDADRIGVCFRNNDGSYFIPDGNQIGTMLLNYVITSMLQKEQTLYNPKNYFTVNTIVTSDLQYIVSHYYGIEMIRTITGFKYIGDVINKEKRSFLFGCEESFGYLIGNHARDKDGIIIGLLTCYFASYLKNNNQSAYEYLQEIYKQFGYYLHSLKTKSFSGPDAMNIIDNIMFNLREFGADKMDKYKILKILDYKKDKTGYKEKNILQFIGENFKITIRPSGTEPKIKFYFQSMEQNENDAKKTLEVIINYFMKIVESF